MDTLITCCQRASIDPSASYETAIQENPLNDHSRSGERKKRSTGHFSNYWARDRILTIGFYDSVTQENKELIKTAALDWQPHINLTLSFIEGTRADIRIAMLAQSSTSQLGTDALLIPYEEPTLIIKNSLSGDRLSAIARHEFGHVLGLRHEHQHPDSNIPWDLTKIYDYYSNHANWDRQTVNFNMLDKWQPHPLFRTVYDTTSIMHYPILNAVTLGDFSVARNFNLSARDIMKVSRIYPKPKPAVL